MIFALKTVIKSIFNKKTTLALISSVTILIRKPSLKLLVIVFVKKSLLNVQRKFTFNSDLLDPIVIKCYAKISNFLTRIY
jgi:hypothetical protein